MKTFARVSKRGSKTKPHSSAVQRPEDDDRSSVTVTETHQSVMDVILVGRVETLSRGGAADEGPDGVDEWHAEDEDRE